MIRLQNPYEQSHSIEITEVENGFIVTVPVPPVKQNPLMSPFVDSEDFANGLNIIKETLAPHFTGDQILEKVRNEQKDAEKLANSLIKESLPETYSNKVQNVHVFAKWEQVIEFLVDLKVPKITAKAKRKK